jgi:hypothetical protein
VRFRIPEIGETFTLRDPWTLILYDERRNWKFAEWAGFGSVKTLHDAWWNSSTWYEDRFRPARSLGLAKLPRGTELKVERIYIRKGAPEFSSLTFSTRLDGKRLRFWVSLRDAASAEWEER